MRNDTIGLETRIDQPGQSQERSRSISENSLAAVLILDSALRVVYANEEAVRITEYAPEELIGRDFLALVDPKTVPLVRDYSTRRQRGEYAPLRYEFSIVRKDGEERLVECSADVVRDSEGNSETVMQFMDTTERYRTEEELKSSHEIFKVIFDYAPDSIYLNDLKGNLIDGNRMTEQLTGYSKEELVGKNFLSAGLLPVSQIPKAACLLAKNVAGKPSGPDELIMKRKDGTLVPVEISTYPVKVKGKTIVMGIARDITTRKRAEEEQSRHRENLETLVKERTKELEDAKQAADAANRAKSTFLAHMSHEIRTPINAIMGFSQLMQRDDTLAPQQRQHLDVINRSGEHLLALITDVLEMSKIEAGRTTLNPTTFSLLALLEDLELMFRLRTEAKKLTFAVEGLGHIPRYVEGDEGKLRQILINLLGNAVKFTGTGGIVLRIRTCHEEAGGVRLEAEVEDTGPGIPEDEQKDLFRPFQQTLNGRLMRSGTGLGLAICKEFVNLMGGDITVDSQPGKGSLFKFHILVGEGEVGFAEKIPESHRVKRLKPGQPGRRVLIADDEEPNGAFLSKLLGEVGFETRQVTNGKDAIEEFQAWRPHLILMDMRMPEMDGCEAARRIRAADGGVEVKIISVSASVFAENRREALEAGADDFLTKPFREAVLFEKIERLLGVEYELAGSATSEKDQARAAAQGAVTAKALAALPKAFIKKMHDAVIQADYDTIMELIDGLGRRRALVAEGLRGLVERFEYSSLLDLLQAKRRNQ
ncbi:MAG: PAS domain S-box protein [Acidobacteria bacterium]|nr:PAS domain S-box protein [Acidobacteriota bacterium]